MTDQRTRQQTNGQKDTYLPLASQVPNGEGDGCPSDGDGLLHEVDAECLDVVLVERALDIFDHERRLANLAVANHPDFDDDTVSAECQPLG